MRIKQLTVWVAGAGHDESQSAVTDKMIEDDARTPGRRLLGASASRASATRRSSRSMPRASAACAGVVVQLRRREAARQESQPLIHDGVMFVTASYSRLYALDARTGQKLWKYEHRLPDGIMPRCDVINRGAALYDNLVIFATLDAQLVAPDQKTGDVV